MNTPTYLSLAQRALASRFQMVSLNTPRFQDKEDSQTEEEYVTCPQESVEASVCRASMRKRLDDVLRTLKPREAGIIRQHFGLDGDERTLLEIGNDLLCLGQLRVIDVKLAARTLGLDQPELPFQGFDLRRQLDPGKACLLKLC